MTASSLPAALRAGAGGLYAPRTTAASRNASPAPGTPAASPASASPIWKPNSPPPKPAGGHLMPAVPVDVADAIELAELLDFLGCWLESDLDNLTASLARFVGSPDYGPDALRDDFARFRFLLGITGGEGVFTPDEP